MANALGSLPILGVIAFLSPALFLGEGFVSRRKPVVVDLTLGGIALAITQDASCCGRCSEAETLHYHGNISAPCQCDQHCLVYRDCCLDFEMHCADLESVLARLGDGGHWRGFRNCSEGRGSSTARPGVWLSSGEQGACTVWSESADNSAAREYACLLEALWVPVVLARRADRHLAHVDGGDGFVYVLVGDCRSEAGGELVGLCETTTGSGSPATLAGVKELVPVTGPDGLHYRNAYCARCSGFPEEDLQFWQVKLHCPADVQVTGLTDASVGGCSVGRVVPPTTFAWAAALPRRVSSGYGCLCSPGTGSDAVVCGVFQVQPGQCCGGLACQSRCRCVIRGNDSKIPLEDWDFLPISALFDFSSNRDLRYSLDDQPHELVCERGTFFDIGLGSCRRFFCPPGHRLGVQGGCVVANTYPCLLSDTREQPVLLLDLEFQTTGQVDLVQSYMVESLTNATTNVTFTPLRTAECSETRQWSRCELRVVVESLSTFAETSTRFVATVKRLLAEWRSASNVTVQRLTLMNFAERAFLFDRCARLGQTPVRYAFGSDFSKSEINGTSVVHVRVDNGSVTCPSDRTFGQVVWTPTGQVEQFVYLCDSEIKLNCSLVVLNASEFGWLGNGTVELASGVKLSNGDLIELSDEEIVVCRQPWGYPNCRDPFREGMLSVVGLIVSQVFLLLTLLSFCVFPELCTLPGKNLFCFIAALFLTQMVFLLGPGSSLGRLTTNSESACLAFAVTIHYLLLATFAWSNVVSLHLARTFGFRLRMRSERFGRAFLWYSLYGWGAPVVLSAAGCILHHTLVVDGKRVVVYGVDSCIPSADGMLYLVAVPISALVCCNAVFFVQTVVGIRRTRRSTSMIEEKRTLERLQSEIILCMKIFLATGMTWFLIALLGYFRVECFSYAFTVLISSQGPLLFLSFAFTERVRGMWRAKLCDRGARRAAGYASKETAVRSISGGVGAAGSPGRAGLNHPGQDDLADDSPVRSDGTAMLLEDRTTDNLYEHVFGDYEAHENQL